MNDQTTPPNPASDDALPSREEIISAAKPAPAATPAPAPASRTIPPSPYELAAQQAPRQENAPDPAAQRAQPPIQHPASNTPRPQGGRPAAPQGGRRSAPGLRRDGRPKTEYTKPEKDNNPIVLGLDGFGVRKSGLNRRFFDRPKQDEKLPQPKPIAKGVLRIIPLGGLQEVGKNMAMIEYGEDIVLVDCGFQFPEEGMHGIDYVIPDVSYLHGKEKNIRALLVTHGHLDHIGGIPYIMPKLGASIPIYAMPLAAALISKRQEEFPQKLNVQSVQQDTILQLGAFRIEFFHVNHNIPDSVGIAITTPVGTVIHTGDWKMDHTPINELPIDLAKIARIGNTGVVAALMDSTSAYLEGYQLSETHIQNTLEGIFMQSQGRIICGTFSSLLSRIQSIITLSARFNRKVVILGRSMKDNVAIASNLKYMSVPKGVVIDVKEMSRYKDEEITVVCTGAQGEKNAALMRMANKEHPNIQFQPGDTVIFSSSFIPGNEQSIQGLMDVIYQQKANVVNYKHMDVHAGGHAKAEETKLLLNLLKPKHFVPVHGNHSFLVMHTQVARTMGYQPEETAHILENGSILEINEKQEAKKLKEKAGNALVAVDGLGVGDVGATVLLDRQTMGSEGIFLVLMNFDREGRLKGNVDVISRGFVFMRGAEELIKASQKLVREMAVKNQNLAKSDPKEFKFLLQRELEKYLFQKTERSPMVIPMIVEA